MRRPIEALVASSSHMFHVTLAGCCALGSDLRSLIQAAVCGSVAEGRAASAHNASMTSAMQAAAGVRPADVLHERADAGEEDRDADQQGDPQRAVQIAAPARHRQNREPGRG